MKVRRNESYLQWPCRATRQGTCLRHILWPQNSVNLLPHPKRMQVTPSSPSCKGNLPHEYTSRVREKIPGRGLWARRHALQKAYKISFGVNAPCECTDNSSIVNGLKFYMTRMHLMQVNAPGQPGERTLGVNAPHECTHTKSIHNYYEIIDLNAPRQLNAPGQSGINII